MSVIPWAQNDELFKKFVSEGYSWQLLPYTFLKLSGLPVEMPELTIRENISESGEWLQTYDLKVGDLTIEVKSRPFAFTNPGDWPLSRAPAFLDTRKKLDAKGKKPFAYVFVSTATGGMVATCTAGKASERWGLKRCRDRKRDIMETFYTVPVEYLVTMDKLVEAIRAKVATH